MSIRSDTKEVTDGSDPSCQIKKTKNKQQDKLFPHQSPDASCINIGSCIEGGSNVGRRQAEAEANGQERMTKEGGVILCASIRRLPSGNQ